MNNITIRQNLVSSSKYSIKCPYGLTPVGICVHNTDNDASANNEISYMISNDNATSYHYAIDDKEVVQGIPENRNAFHAGDGREGDGNRKYLGVEICYSKSGSERFIKAEKNAAIFIAMKLKERNWDISYVKKHQDFSGKYCPRRTLDMGWQRFLNMIQAELDELNEEEEPMTAAEKKAFEQLQSKVDELTKAIEAKTERVYHYWNELPDWAYNPIKALYDKGYFAGNSPSDLNLPYGTMRTLVILARALKADGKLNF